MQTGKGLLAAHREQALLIDEKMREAGRTFMANFLGKEVEVESILDRFTEAKYEFLIDYFIHLSYAYALSSMGETHAQHRPAIEFFAQAVILQAALGKDSLVVVATTDTFQYKLGTSTSIPMEAGPHRLQIGKDTLVLAFRQLGHLPSTYEAFTDSKSKISRGAFGEIFRALVRKKKTAEEKESERKEEAERFVAEVKRICDDWKIDCLPKADHKGWLFEELQTS
ncbi:MAG: hypothetical protein JST51_13415 [Armatimonadetes bacterium]|nr:hypothetical protein [Armatimonadota bacterium]